MIPFLNMQISEFKIAGMPSVFEECSESFPHGSAARPTLCGTLATKAEVAAGRAARDTDEQRASLSQALCLTSCLVNESQLLPTSAFNFIPP